VFQCQFNPSSFRLKSGPFDLKASRCVAGVQRPVPCQDSCAKDVQRAFLDTCNTCRYCYFVLHSYFTPEIISTATPSNTTHFIKTVVIIIVITTVLIKLVVLDGVIVLIIS
jgi:hypothetical protein